MSRTTPGKRRHGFFQHHSMGIISLCVLGLWIGLYHLFGPQGHLGAFFGNAVADWTGVALTVIGTKFLYEKGSAESRSPKSEPKNPVLRFLHDHSLVIFLLLTGAIWAAAYMKTDEEAKWGQVLGNIVSEWTQLVGLVLLSEKFEETRSKESTKS